MIEVRPLEPQAEQLKPEAREFANAVIAEAKGKGDATPEDCPCGTESCRAAWRELREAAASAKAEAQNFEQPLGDPPRSQADLDAEAEEDRQRSEIKAHWRQLIREEVAKETSESSREIAVQLIALGERLSAVELHEAANKPRHLGGNLLAEVAAFREHLREQVAREVAVQLEVAFARLYAFVSGAIPPQTP